MRVRISWWLIGFGSTFFCLSWKPLPNALLRQFENFYQVPMDSIDKYAGVVVLGGGTHSKYTVFDGQQERVSEVSDRLVQSVALIWKNSHLQLIYTSQESSQKVKTSTIKAVRSQAARFFLDMRIPTDRLIMESNATNTHENAIFTAALPGIDINRPWLLLTSAAHMPRALATFRMTGWNVTAYPVDFRTKKYVSWMEFSLADSAQLWQNFAYEALGYLEYRLRGWA